MDWFLCNRCFVKIAGRGLHFTQCGHIYCKKCFPEVQKQCLHCGEENIQSVESTDRKNFEKVKHFFKPTGDLKESLLATENFQQMQLEIFIQRRFMILQTYAELKERFELFHQDFKTLSEKYEILKLHTKKLKKNQTALEMYLKQQKVNCNTETLSNYQFLTPSMISQRQLFKTPSLPSISRGVTKSVSKPPSTSSDSDFIFNPKVIPKRPRFLI